MAPSQHQTELVEWLSLRTSRTETEIVRAAPKPSIPQTGEVTPAKKNMLTPTPYRTVSLRREPYRTVRKKCNSTARCCCRKPPPHHHTARCRFRSKAHAKQNLTQDTPKTSSSDHLGNTLPRGKGRVMAAIKRKEPAHLGPEQRALLISRTDNLDKASAKRPLS